MLERTEIGQKLTLLVQYLGELRQIGEHPFQEFQRDFRVKRTVERLIQLVVECATDINGLIITGLGHPPPESYYSSFVILADIGVLAPDFASQLAPTTAIRNRLVHEYDSVDERLVYASIQSILEEFSEYVRQISDYLGQ